MRLPPELRTLSRLAFSSHRAARATYDWLEYVLHVIVRPLAFVVTMALMGRFASGDEAATDFALGAAVYGLLGLTTAGLVQEYVREQYFGTFPHLFIAQGDRGFHHGLRIVPHIPNGLLSCASALGLAVALLQIDVAHANPIGVLLALLSMVVSTTCLGLILGPLCATFREHASVLRLVDVVVLLLSGVVIPRERLPHAARALGEILPITHGLEALKLALDGAPTLQLSPLLGEAAIAIGCLVLGIASRLATEVLVRRSASYS